MHAKETKKFRENFSCIVIKSGYNVLVIVSFDCKETEKIFHGKYSRKFPADIQPRAMLKLQQIHAASSVLFLRIPPSNRLEQLSGNLKGMHSIRINQQWRIIFRWNDQGASIVKITDYH